MGRPGKKSDRLKGSGPTNGGLSVWETDHPRAGAKGCLTPELSYRASTPASHRRQFAQFFTPPKIAKLMAEWAVTPATRNMLEPALGMGVLVRAALDRSADIQVTAFEKDPIILRAFLSSHPDLGKVEPLLADFLIHDLALNFDAVLMNPPYLRHHDLSYDFDIFDKFGLTYGIELSRLSNAYLLFTIKAAMALRPGGRASIIIPTEWMNANFGAAMKHFLIGRGFLREMIYFSSCSHIFDDALTTASILLLERPAS
jgi:adenine-specific DNA-methyltransferase